MKTKKNFSYLGILLTAALSLFLFCSDNDDDEKSSSPEKITIQSSDMALTIGQPVSINFIRFDNKPECNYEQGENKKWDFSQLELDTAINFQVSPLPENPAFPEADYTFTDSLYILGFSFPTTVYVKKNDDCLQKLGFTFDSLFIPLSSSGDSYIELPGQTIQYEPEEILYHFPISYGNSMEKLTSVRTLRLYVTYPLLSLSHTLIEHKSTLEKTTEVLGWGEILLPREEKSRDVLYIKKNIIIYTNIYMNGALVPQNLLNYFNYIQGDTLTNHYIHEFRQKNGNQYSCFNAYVTKDNIILDIYYQ